MSKKYLYVGLTFVLLSIGVLLFVAYIVWARVTVTITPVATDISREFFITVGDQRINELPVEERPEVDIVGSILTTTLDISQTYTASGETTLTPEDGIVGEVTITNSHGQPQTLVETTRLADPADPETVLIRLAQTVTVPAGETVTVPVYFENPETQTEIAPMRFIIPGLWGVLQERIYAENVDVLGNFERTVAVATTEDIDRAQTELRRAVTEEVLQRSEEVLDSNVTWPKIVYSDSSAVSVSTTPNTITKQFQTSYNGAAYVITFDEAEVRRYAQDIIRLTESRTLEGGLDFTESTFEYSVDFFDAEDSVVTLKVVAQGRAQALQNSDIRAKESVRGMSKEEAEAYYREFPEVEEVKIEFQPSWLRKIPLLTEKIYIIIQ